jgi:ectoine hydroxylase-related dioxygenase (phytanoyl-CoA dioxygenase family)
VIERVRGNLRLGDGEVPAASEQLEREGWVVLPGAIDPELLARLRPAMLRLFSRTVDSRPVPKLGDQYRHAACNRSKLARQAIASRSILDVVEPLLGDDCHVIANTLWRNPAEGFVGQAWHTDAGPHVPRPEGVPWDDRIPYPVFVVAAHLLLDDLTEDDGATAVIPRSHRSGRPVPLDRRDDLDLECDGIGPHPITGSRGDVVLFCSDIWHRGLPARPGATGRFFLQCHYGRRDIAQRLTTTQAVNQLAPRVASSGSGRDATLLGLHRPHFYDG